MTNRDRLIKELEDLPEPALDAVLDFVRSIRTKEDRIVGDTALASEEALARDWLRPEEDEAWSDL